MPRYEYHCSECNSLITVLHLSDEKETDCSKCLAKNSLVKQLTNFMNLSKKKETKTQIGDVTEEFIQSSREELKKQKRDMKDTS